MTAYIIGKAKDALLDFSLRNGRWPDSQEEAGAVLSSTEPRLVADAFGETLIYIAPASPKPGLVASKGADRTLGTDDDQKAELEILNR